MGRGTAGTSQSLGGCPPAHLGAQQCRCTSRRGQGSRKGVCTPTCTRIHRRTHLWVSICIDTCTQPRPDIPHGQLCVCVSTHTLSPTHTPMPAYYASSCSQQLSLPSLLGLAFQGVHDGASADHTSSGIPGHTGADHRRGASPSLSVCLWRCPSLWGSPRTDAPISPLQTPSL